MQSPDQDTESTQDAAAARGLAPAPLGEAIIAALAFFTRLPLRPQTQRPLAANLAGFAPAGALIGLNVGLILAGFGGLGMPGLLAALLAIGAGLILTGALHEDGLADCADALGRADRNAALEIMRDSRLGSFGGLALILSVALRGAAIDGPIDAGPLLRQRHTAGETQRGYQQQGPQAHDAGIDRQ